MKKKGMTNSNAIEEDILNVKPHWITRNGNWLFLFILFMLVIISWFIKIPASVNAVLTKTGIQDNLVLVLKKKDLEELQLQEKNNIYISAQQLKAKTFEGSVTGITNQQDSLYNIQISPAVNADGYTNGGISMITITKKTRLLHLVIQKLHF